MRGGTGLKDLGDGVGRFARTSEDKLLRSSDLRDVAPARNVV